MLLRRWPLYLLASAVVIGFEYLIYATVHMRFSDFYAQLVGMPLLIVVVTVYTGCDARDELPAAAARWGRIFERAWIIIVIDVALSFVETAGFENMQAGDAADLFLGMMVLFLGAMLVYAEPYVCLDEHLQALTAIPFAALRSMMLAWVNMPRIFLLLALELAVFFVENFVQLGAARLVRNPIWIDIAFSTILQAPLAALFTVAYLDTLSQERKMVAR